jgi:bifunctional DNase/RNase
VSGDPETTESDHVEPDDVTAQTSSSAGDGASPDSGADGDATAEPDDALAVTYRVMTVESVLYELGDPSPEVHLMEAEAPYRSLSVPIALSDAQALHQALYSVAGRRPGTHELTTTMLARLRTDVVAARIVRVESGIFYAELEVMTPQGREVFDCRTSDALILAMRQRVPAPVLCNEEILSSD